MAAKHVNPTRMELTNLKRKLVVALRGHRLLKDKRDELMRQFLELVQENRKLRQQVEEGINAANKNFALASAVMQNETLKTAFLTPKQEVTLEVGKKNIMSVEIPVFTYQTRTSDPNDIYSYGYAFTSGDLDSAVKSLADILPLMLELAEKEKACQMMAAEIEKTRRRVNALEHVVIPEMQENIKYITMKLDENERSTQVRLMKVKDMLLEQEYQYSKRYMADG
ncbi:MAG: V-type ATP synthase subunit D [Caldicoprobacterales bacterium]